MSKRVLIYGGRGALGSVCVEYFNAHSWWTCSVDLVTNDAAAANVVVQPSDSLVEQSNQVTKDVESVFGAEKLDAILCVAGGWAGGNAAHADFVKNCDLMWKQSCWSSVIAAHLGAKHLKEGGLLQLTGAQAALKGTPGMIGYGMAKAAVHQLIESLSTADGGLPSNASALAILPITLDTPMNRKWMPKADHSTWTSMEFVAKQLHEWSENQNRPKSGSLVQLITKGGETSLVVE